MTELMLKAFAIIWLILSVKRMISRIKIQMMGEEAAKEYLKELVEKMMDMLLMLEGLPVQIVTVLVMLMPLLSSLLNLGGLFFAGLYSRPENIDRACILFFAIITVADYVRQYPGLVKIKQYIEDALEKEVMQRKILELVEHEHKIKGVGDMASIGAVLGSMYLCFILFVP
ncbi:hypothetical protein [Selenomonas sp. AB3002]|uniref:hypothetical protein n=1 Tax=Selenomonas sp. AB3002 TaxID=1392502 RepID=UPI000497FD9E